MKAGVLQGSVLSPLLWNIVFDSVLHRGTEHGCLIVCYADDTLVLASADTERSGGSDKPAGGFGAWPNQTSWSKDCHR